MKTIKNLETQETKKVEISKMKKPEKTEEKNLKSFHFPQTGKVIFAESFEEAQKKYKLLTKKI